MRIVIELHHPGDPLFFQHPVAQWLARGHQVTLVGRDRGPMTALVGALFPRPDGVTFEVRTASRISRFNQLPLRELAVRQLAVARAIVERRADVVVSLFGVYAQSAWLFGRRNIVFTDSEFQRLAHRIAHPFASAVVTPRCYRLDEGRKHVRYDGYHELCYLHPRRFSPEPAAALADAGLSRQRPLCFVRLSAWNTSHDTFVRGMSASEQRDLVSRLSAVGDVVISFEGEAPPELAPLSYRGVPERLHHLLAAADLVVSEGATTASEAALLGVPTIFVNPTRRCYLDDQRDRFDLCVSARSYQQARPWIDEMLARLSRERDAVRAQWRARRARMLEQMVDVAAFVSDFVEAHAGARR